MTTYFSYPSIEVQKELKCIAETLVTPGKGILAADESVSTMGKRLQEVGVNNDDDVRRQWRQLLFSTDRQISDFISGVILFHETLCQKDENGKLLTEYLKERCIIPGIKVDTGLVTMYNSEDEVTTQGLDNLGARLAQYKAEGCEFARWRCVFKIGKHTPSYTAILTNSVMIARFASICQSQRICPIIEPEVIPDGDHDIERCQKVTETVLSFVYRALNDHHVFLEGTLLKPNMVTSGLTSKSHIDPNVIASATLTALQRTVPAAVPGICFSSGGQTEEEATVNLNAINQMDGMKPWKMTFAFGRALQASALRAWGGRPEQEKPAQEEFLKRAKANGDAAQGAYHGNQPMQSKARPTNPQINLDRKNQYTSGPTTSSSHHQNCHDAEFTIIGKSTRRNSVPYHTSKFPMGSPRQTPKTSPRTTSTTRYGETRTSTRFPQPPKQQEGTSSLCGPDIGPDGQALRYSNTRGYETSRYSTSNTNLDLPNTSYTLNSDTGPENR